MQTQRLTEVQARHNADMKLIGMLISEALTEYDINESHYENLNGLLNFPLPPIFTETEVNVKATLYVKTSLRISITHPANIPVDDNQLTEALEENYNLIEIAQSLAQDSILSAQDIEF